MHRPEQAREDSLNTPRGKASRSSIGRDPVRIIGSKAGQEAERSAAQSPVAREAHPAAHHRRHARIADRGRCRGRGDADGGASRRLGFGDPGRPGRARARTSTRNVLRRGPRSPADERGVAQQRERVELVHELRGEICTPAPGRPREPDRDQRRPGAESREQHRRRHPTISPYALRTLGPLAGDARARPPASRADLGTYWQRREPRTRASTRERRAAIPRRRSSAAEGRTGGPGNPRRDRGNAEPSTARTRSSTSDGRGEKVGIGRPRCAHGLREGEPIRTEATMT